jgi:hypothetical protein
VQSADRKVNTGRAGGPAAHVIAAPASWSPEQGGHHFGRGDYDIANDLISKLNGGSQKTESAHLKYLKAVANDLVKGNWDAIERSRRRFLRKGRSTGISSARR